MKSSDPLLFTDPAGKVAISQHLVTPGSPGVTILSASSVRMLAFIEMKHSRPPDLKSASHLLGLQVRANGPSSLHSLLHENLSLLSETYGEKVHSE